MTEPRSDDAMMEIGDIDEDPTPPAGTEGPRVVIEYRDRGVPWMLVPPLLAMAAVVAGVGAYAWVESRRERRPDPVVRLPADEAPIDPVTPALPAPRPVDPPLPPGSVTPGPAPVAAFNPPSSPAPESSPDVPPAAEAVAEAAPAPPPGPRVEALGFDPAAIREPAAAPPGPMPGAPVDRDVAAVAQGDPAQPGPAGAADAGAAAEEVEALPLPPDPRLARAQRIERDRALVRKAAQDRVRFHAELQAICRQLGQRATPAIKQLCDRYSCEVPAAAKERAIKELGPRGSFVGVSLDTRINFLRRIGFPEPLILGDLYDIQTSKETPGGRNMPSPAVVYVHAARILLAHPPTRSSPAARGAAPPQANSRPAGPAPPGG